MINLLYFGILTIISLVMLYIFVNQYFLVKKYYELQRKLIQIIVVIFFDFFLILIRSFFNFEVDVYYSLLIAEMILDFIIMSMIADTFSVIGIMQYPNSEFRRKYLPLITTIYIIIISVSLSYLFADVLVNNSEVSKVFSEIQKRRLIPYISLILFNYLIVPKSEYMFGTIKVSFLIIMFGFILEYLYLSGITNLQEIYYTVKLIGFAMALNSLYKIKFA